MEDKIMYIPNDYKFPEKYGHCLFESSNSGFRKSTQGFLGQEIRELF